MTILNLIVWLFALAYGGFGVFNLLVGLGDSLYQDIHNKWHFSVNSGFDGSTLGVGVFLTGVGAVLGWMATWPGW